MILSAVGLAIAAREEEYWWVWIIGGLEFWGMLGGVLYGVGVLIGWIRRGFAKPNG